MPLNPRWLPKIWFVWPFLALAVGAALFRQPEFILFAPSAWLILFGHYFSRVEWAFISTSLLMTFGIAFLVRKRAEQIMVLPLYYAANFGLAYWIIRVLGIT
jgi:hypothetical protein